VGTVTSLGQIASIRLLPAQVASKVAEEKSLHRQNLKPRLSDALLKLGPGEPVPRLLHQQYPARPEHPRGFHKRPPPLRNVVNHAEDELRFPFSSPLYIGMFIKWIFS
jgi:hypothetical protein